MFKGFTRSILIISGFMLGLPAVILGVHGGADWVEQLRSFTPIF